MASAVADLEAGLQAMLNLKPPGVSGSRITSLTSLCVANIQSESVLIQKIYTHFKKAPGTHKLGVLYVVDSVTRKWLEQAKAQGQAINGSAQDGTYAAGVHRVTELMPVLMNDILQSAPEEQKEKIKKLLDIWEKGQTFPASMLDSFKEKLSAPRQATEPLNSTTPPGSPPASVLGSLQNLSAATAPALPTNGSSILEALANIARQNTTAAPSNPSLPAPAASYTMPSAALPQPASSTYPPPQPPASYPSAPQPVNMPSLPFSLPQMLGQNAPPSAMPASNHSNPYPGAPPAPGSSGIDTNTQQQILLIKALADQGVPFDKIPALIQSMTGGSSNLPNTQPPPAAAQNPYAPGQQPWGAPVPLPGDVRDRGYQDGLKSPPRYRGGRSRSRSPDRGWGARNSPRGGRDRSEFARDTPPRGRHDDRDRDGRRGNDYRQRSPQGRHGRSNSPSDDLPQVEKWIEYDPSLPSGHIKVFSRTLFVGGVTCSEAELRNIFSRFGTVQTCIVNKDKRHAFVKMISRRDAVAAKEGTEDNRNLEVALRTRWGVGFGPRDCSDYSSGVSIIPIQKLTEADRKWMLTAPYGGSGGRPIETGICVEEPDIEIGAGVSSKAISRRMQTDKGGSNGPKSTRGRDDDLSRWRRSRDEGHGGGNARKGGHDDGMAHGGPMGGFPFGIGTLPNGMPNFPAGFAFPDPGAGGH
ncbi:Rpb7-binding protein seb1 [Paramyrothecium foliicola]|nr:Rpb7-binding protein seb1 [Paramyrothecium foliicola]